jgi:hypothetical protein
MGNKAAMGDAGVWLIKHTAAITSLPPVYQIRVTDPPTKEFYKPA